MLYITLPPFPKLIFMIVRLDFLKLYLKTDEFDESEGLTNKKEYFTEVQHIFDSRSSMA